MDSLSRVQQLGTNREILKFEVKKIAATTTPTATTTTTAAAAAAAAASTTTTLDKTDTAGVGKCPNVSHHPTIGDISSPTDMAVLVICFTNPQKLGHQSSSIPSPVQSPANPCPPRLISCSPASASLLGSPLSAQGRASCAEVTVRSPGKPWRKSMGTILGKTLGKIWGKSPENGKRILGNHWGKPLGRCGNSKFEHSGKNRGQDHGNFRGYIYIYT